MAVLMTHDDVDRKLIQSARGGDRVAFDTLASRSEARVAAFVRSRIRPDFRARLDVDEIVQDTFVRAFQSIAGFQGEDFELFVRWLLGVARIAVIRAVREASQADVELVVDPADREVSPSHAMRREDRFNRLQQALNRLTDDQREVVYLSRVEGLSMKEVASRMGRSPDAVRKLFSRALQRLRERMDETGSLHLPDRMLRRKGDDDARE